MADKLTFIGGIRKFFGMKAGQAVSDFSKELKDLTPKDRNELHEMLVKVPGYESCDPPANLTTAP